MVGLIVIFISFGTFILAINVIYTTLKERRYNEEEKLKENRCKDLELIKEKVLKEFRNNNNMQFDKTYKQAKYLRKEFMKRAKELKNKE